MATITFAVAVVWAVVMSTRYVFVSSEGCVNTTTGVKSFKLEITPTTRTPVTGGAVTFKCSIEFETASAQRLKTRLHHLWLYAPHLSTRMAGFHPQKPPNPQDPDVSQSFGNVTRRIFVDHPEGPRCGQYGPVSCADASLAAVQRSFTSRWNMDSYAPQVGADASSFSMTVRNEGPVCCDNGEYYCWFFIFDPNQPCEGFKSAPVTLNVQCDPLILAGAGKLCYTNLTTQLAEHDRIYNQILGNP